MNTTQPVELFYGEAFGSGETNRWAIVIGFVLAVTMMAVSAGLVTAWVQDVDRSFDRELDVQNYSHRSAESRGMAHSGGGHAAHGGARRMRRHSDSEWALVQDQRVLAALSQK